MRNLDVISWQTLLFSFVGIAVVTVIGVAIRLLVMQTVQQRRDRENRQIIERLRKGKQAAQRGHGQNARAVALCRRISRRARAGDRPVPAIETGRTPGP